jgi:hypothetical protein
VSRVRLDYTTADRGAGRQGGASSVIRTPPRNTTDVVRARLLSIRRSRDAVTNLHKQIRTEEDQIAENVYVLAVELEYTVPTVAQLTGISQTKIRQLIERGRSVRAGRQANA